jgi:hypothetical protein
LWSQSTRYGDAKTLPAIDVLFKDGFDSVVDSLKRGLDIRYGAAVGEVAQGAGGVSLTTAAGAVFSAPYAITTQPLGVLKEGLVRFDPELPPRKRAAIAQMVRPDGAEHSAPAPPCPALPRPAPPCPAPPRPAPPRPALPWPPRGAPHG